ncbi:hypothetical protein PENSUB_4802 [Penicillium subrubescens]|uniref:Uncharacterized protein n=1 Tax=Penicillium subrubescens TaxID=1316194 RepID=A0A1Q5UBL8_9EURO|nr:hypothetical protein PENSUB_4802 [Penicillium subrubescens]
MRDSSAGDRADIHNERPCRNYSQQLADRIPPSSFDEKLQSLLGYAACALACNSMKLPDEPDDVTITARL